VVYRPAPEFRGAQFGRTAASLKPVLLAIALLFLLWPYSSSRAAELTPAGGPAKPDFSLHDLNGKIVPLTAFKGRTVLVHFFATWCEPCREELPALNRFLKRAASNASVVAISVAEVDPRVKRFFDAAPVDFPVLLDRDRTIAKSWKISALPTTYVLDASMKPMLVVEADFAWDTVDVEPATGKLIKSKAGEIKKTSERPSNPKTGGNDHEL
jgi:thiol-disulfide isomerase/thioredoxin